MASYIRAHGSGRRRENPDLVDLGAALPNKRKRKRRSPAAHARRKLLRARRRARAKAKPKQKNYALGEAISEQITLDNQLDQRLRLEE